MSAEYTDIFAEVAEILGSKQEVPGVEQEKAFRQLAKDVALEQIDILKAIGREKTPKGNHDLVLLPNEDERKKLIATATTGQYVGTVVLGELPLIVYNIAVPSFKEIDDFSTANEMTSLYAQDIGGTIDAVRQLAQKAHFLRNYDHSNHFGKDLWRRRKLYLEHEYGNSLYMTISMPNIERIGPRSQSWAPTILIGKRISPDQ